MMSDKVFLDINAAFGILAVLINLVFIILVLLRTSRSFFFILFLLICVADLFWNFFQVSAYLTTSKLPIYVSMIFSALIPAFVIHFVYKLCRPKQSVATRIVFLYFLSGILALIPLFLVLSPKLRWFADEGYWDIAYLIMLSPFYIWGFVLLIDTYRRSAISDEKMRLMYVLLSAVVGVLAVASDRLHTLGFPVPFLGQPGSVLYMCILAIGVYKYREAFDIVAQTKLKLDALHQIAVGIAHEIRNPLFAIKGAVGIVRNRMKNSGSEEIGKYVDIVAEEIVRLDRVLESFQYLARPLRIEKEMVSVNDVIQKTVKLIENDASHLKITLDLSSELPLIPADVVSLKQVFINLIKNAAEACTFQGSLIITTEKHSSFIKIIFHDSGCGIPADLRDRIFEPFLTTKPKGMGLGLAISKRLVEAHGGWIEVNNDLSQGTQFSVTLPFR